MAAAPVGPEYPEEPGGSTATAVPARPEHAPEAPRAAPEGYEPPVEPVTAVQPPAEPPVETQAEPPTRTASEPRTQSAPEPLTERRAETASAPAPGTEPRAETAPEPQSGTQPQAAAEPQSEPLPQAAAQPRTAPEPPTVAGIQTAAGTEGGFPFEPDSETGDEAIHTLLWTAATERPVDEVASLVARLKQTGALSSPADVALRAAAVSRPLDEVRQLLALLNASGYDMHQAETTLRAAAVGRPIEDVVQLVSILGTDSSDWRSLGGGDAEERKAGTAQADGVKAGREAVPVVTAAAKPPRGSAKWPATLDGALASGPGSHAPSPAVRSALRWPAALALFACGLIHLPTDMVGLRTGGPAETLTVAVTILCLLCGIWLVVRDTLMVWAAAAGLAVGVIALHVLASARTVDLLHSSLGSTFAWAKATAVLSAAAVIALAGSALMRHTRTTSAADSA
ncbi:hypothetical protein [Streptomyces sp. NPDC093600]|uniref:hypothetical protein n=1 Tax=Streptomyces sp. NPDC093600 TaxID=3366047 RepID=UPI00380D1F55